MDPHCQKVCVHSYPDIHSYFPSLSLLISYYISPSHLTLEPQNYLPDPKPLLLAHAPWFFLYYSLLNLSTCWLLTLLDRPPPPKKRKPRNCAFPCCRRRFEYYLFYICSDNTQYLLKTFYNIRISFSWRKQGIFKSWLFKTPNCGENGNIHSSSEQRRFSHVDCEQ